MQTSEKIRVKIFIGLAVTPALRNALHHSHSWKEAQFDTPFEEILKDKKRYVGFYLENERIPMGELKGVWKTLRQKVLPHCPQINLDTVPLVMFPQYFIR